MRLISLEGNLNFVGGQSMNYENIRDDASYYGTVTKNLRAVAYMGSVGTRMELRTLNNKFGLSSGLQFAKITSSLTKASGWWLTNDFFYFMINQSETSIEYLKVKAINQTSDYIGIPVNITWYPFKERVFTIYFKAGFEFNYNLKTKTEVVLVDELMSQFSENVVGKFSEPQKFVSIFNTSAGMKIGKESKATFLFEMGPSLFLNSRTSGILNANAGFGIRGGIQIPF